MLCLRLYSIWNVDFTWAIVLVLHTIGIGTLRNERLCIRATGPSRQSAKAKSKNGTATVNGRLSNEQTSYQGMIQSFHGTIRSYHGMIRPFQDTNNRFKLNALYNVIIFDWFSFGSRSVLVRSSFGPRSSFVHPSFGIRSGFVRDSKNNQRSYEEATEMHLRHNGGITKDERSQNEGTTMPKRSLNRRSPFAFQNDSFCSPKGLLLQSKTTPFRHQKDYIMN